MDIKVLGTGCANCKNTIALIEQVATAKGVPVTLSKVEELRDIMGYGVMSTPGVVIDGKVVHVPYTDLLKPDGSPKAAKDIWAVLNKAGVPRYAEIVVFADMLGDAAVNYVVLRMMGFADVKVWAP